MSKIELINASCADQEADVIVNAANSGLWAGGGICGVIFRKAGMAELTEACKKYKTPLKDGDIERPNDEAFKNSFYLNASSKYKPKVVNRKVEPITNEAEVYSGCYGKISVVFYGFTSGDNMGIAAGLGNIQKIVGGESLERRSVLNEFDIIDEENFSLENIWEI